MPDPRPHLAASLAGLDDEPVESLHRLAALGYRAVQLSATRQGMRPRDLDGAARRALKALLRRIELTPSGVDLWIPSGHFADPARSDRAVAAVSEAVELAAELGRVPVSLNLPAMASENAALRDVIESMLGHADRHGIDLVDCATPPASDAVRATLAHAGRLRVGVDPAAWLAQRGDPVAAIVMHAALLGGVRLCDLTRSGMRAPVADGDCGGAREDAQLDAAAFAATLSVAAPQVTPVADPRQWREPWEGLAQTKEVWERVGVAGLG